MPCGGVTEGQAQATRDYRYDDHEADPHPAPSPKPFRLFDERLRVELGHGAAVRCEQSHGSSGCSVESMELRLVAR